MGRLSRNWFVLGASGGISLCMKMETYYQKNYAKEQTSEERQPEVSIPLAYESEQIQEKYLKNLNTHLPGWVKKFVEFYTSDLKYKMIYKK